METLSRDDVERIMFFEQAREQAAAEHAANPTDALALTKWGGALLELAHFRQGGEAHAMIEEAVDKFRHALRLEERHDTLWCLGNAYTSQGFLSAQAEVAAAHFERASECFRKAVAAEPTNESYKRALEMTAKAPQLYAELQRQLAAAGASSPRGVAAGAAGAGGAAKDAQGAVSDFWYDVGGWVTLVALGLGIAALGRGGAGAVAAAPSQ